MKPTIKQTNPHKACTKAIWMRKEGDGVKASNRPEVIAPMKTGQKISGEGGPINLLLRLTYIAGVMSLPITGSGQVRNRLTTQRIIPNNVMASARLRRRRNG